MNVRFTPEMNPEEISLIMRYIGNSKPTFFEWGSGGSTIEYAKYCSRYVSIESYDEWYKLVSPHVSPNVELHLITNNKPRSQEDTLKEEYLDYVNAVDRFKGQTFDLVLVDGRARKYCAERALDLLHDDSFVFVHDWSRPRYRNYVLDFYDIVEEVNEIVVLKAKK